MPKPNLIISFLFIVLRNDIVNKTNYTLQIIIKRFWNWSFFNFT